MHRQSGHPQGTHWCGTMNMPIGRRGFPHCPSDPSQPTRYLSHRRSRGSFLYVSSLSSTVPPCAACATARAITTVSPLERVGTSGTRKRKWCQVNPRLQRQHMQFPGASASG